MSEIFTKEEMEQQNMDFAESMTKDYVPSKKCSELMESLRDGWLAVEVSGMPNTTLADGKAVRYNKVEDILTQLDQHYQEVLETRRKEWAYKCKVKLEEIESLKKEIEGWASKWNQLKKLYLQGEDDFKNRELELLREIQKHFCIIHSGEEGTNSYIQFDPLTLDTYIENKIKELTQEN